MKTVHALSIGTLLIPIMHSNVCGIV